MTHWLRAIWGRSLAAVRKDRLDREFDEELTTHLELLIDEGRRRGTAVSRDGARQGARSGPGQGRTGSAQEGEAAGGSSNCGL